MEIQTVDLTKVASSPARSPFVEEMDRYFYAVRTRQVSMELVHRVFAPVDEARVGTIDERYIGATSGIEIWMKSRGGTIGQAVVEIASALDMIGPQKRQWLLQQLSVEGEDPEATIAIAVQSKVLVLVHGTSPSAYFRQKQIEVQWGSRGKLWEYFTALCKAAKAGKSIDSMSFDDAMPRQLTDWKSKLLKYLNNSSPDLAKCISAKGGSHKLDLNPRDIKIFTWECFEKLVEWLPPQCSRH